MKIFAVVLFAAAILINPSGAVLSARGALVTCVNSVIPSLFPFFVCSRMLIEMGVAQRIGRILAPVMKPLFGVGGGGALVFVLGILSGYPVGAAAAADLVKNGGVTKKEAEKLLGYCNNSGPLFILGTLGAGLLGNVFYGRVLYISHIMSAFTIALLMRKIPCKISRENSAVAPPYKHFGEIAAKAVGDGAQSVFAVCGFVIIFAILTNSFEYFAVFRLLALAGLDENIIKVFVFGLFEPVGGCVLAAKTFLNSPLAQCMALSAIIGWSGISVHLQVLGIIKKEGLSAKYYFLGKLGMTAISPVYTYILFRLFPKAYATFVFLHPDMTKSAPFPYVLWFMFACLICFLFLKKGIE